jgi:hypothetical protein
MIPLSKFPEAFRATPFAVSAGDACVVASEGAAKATQIPIKRISKRIN